MREQLAAAGATPAQLEFVHFACTSEDINNLAYALMLAEARERILLPAIAAVADHLAGARRPPCRARHAFAHARPGGVADDARQGDGELRRAAAPRGRRASVRVEILGKFNGAVGSFNAHVAGRPDGRLARASRAGSSRASA